SRTRRRRSRERRRTSAAPLCRSSDLRRLFRRPSRSWSRTSVRSPADAHPTRAHERRFRCRGAGEYPGTDTYEPWLLCSLAEAQTPTNLILVAREYFTNHWSSREASLGSPLASSDLIVVAL